MPRSWRMYNVFSERPECRNVQILGGPFELCCDFALIEMPDTIAEGAAKDGYLSQFRFRNMHFLINLKVCCQSNH